MSQSRTKICALLVLSILIWVGIGIGCYFFFRPLTYSFLDYNLLIILGYLGGSCLLGLIGIQRWLYLTSDQLLENPNRNRVFTLICSHPGIHFCEIKRAIPITNGLIQYHLNMLLMGSKIKVMKIGQYTCYFEKNRILNDFLDESAITALLIQKSPVSLQIYKSIKQSREISVEDLRKQFGLTRSTVQYHLKKLKKLQLIT